MLSGVFALVYAGVLVSIGFALRHRSRRRVDAYLAGRNLGTGLVALSLAATVTGGTATVVLARGVYADGLTGLWLDLPLGCAIILFGLFLAGRVRQSGCYSLPEIAGKLYNQTFRKTVAFLVVLAAMGWFALLVRAGAPFLASLTPLGEDGAALALAAVFIAYTALGGQTAVAWTDGLQLVLVGCAGLLFPAAAILLRTDGLAGLDPDLLRFPTSGSMDGWHIAGLVALVGLPGLVGGDIWSKALCARDASTARRGCVIAGCIKLSVALCVAIIALGARIVQPTIETGNDVLSATIAEVLPPSLTALASLAFLAAMMSSADSVLLTGTTVIDVDLLPSPATSHAERRRIRLLLLCLGLSGAFISVAESNIIELMKWAYTIFAAGAPLPILIAFQGWVRVPAWAATASLIVGGLVGAAAKLLHVTRFEPVLIGLAASALLLSAGIATTSLKPHK